MLVVIAAGGACDTREAMEPELRFELSRAYEDIDDARRALASGADPTFPCTAVKQAIDHLGGRRMHDVQQRLVKEGQKVCRDATAKFAGALTTRLEAARGREREEMARECTDLGRAVALLEGLAPADEEIPTLRKKRKVLCP